MSKGIQLQKRLARWLMWNVAAAFLPLAITLSLHGLAHKSIWVALMNSPEILVFTMIVSASAAGDISEVAKPLKWEVGLSILFYVLVIGIAMSVALYAAFVYDTAVVPKPTLDRPLVLKASVWLAILFSIASLVAQFFVGKIESGINEKPEAGTTT